MYTLLSVALATLAGLLMTRIMKPLKLPDVTAYLISGVLIGPYVLGALHIEGLGFASEEAVEKLTLISSVALAFIAFSIGNEFKLTELKKTGKQAVVVGICEALTASFFVDIAMLILHFILPDKLSVAQAITMGAIACATAPAATLMVVRQYKAKGPLTSLLLQVVALDDAICLIVFAVSFGIAEALQSGVMNIYSIAVNPLIEIVMSLLLGACMGWVLTKLETLFHSNTNRLTMTLATVFLAASIAMMEFQIGPVTIGFSSLLVCMMLGAVFCNICPLADDLMDATNKWTTPLFALFFVISGAELELGVFTDAAIVLIGLVYILIRCLGKYTGAFIGSKSTGCTPEIQKYLGVTLFPQAGVALGMCTLAMELGEPGVLIRNITLFAVLVYEMVGPILTRMSLERAGDITPISDEIKNRRQNKLDAAAKQK